MSYIEKHLIQGEKVVYQTRLHWIMLVIPFLLGLVIAVPGIALLMPVALGNKNASSVPLAIGGGFLILLAAIVIFRGILMRSATEMAVTNMRVVVKIGVASRRTGEMLLSRVESIGVEESAAGRVLGYGTVVIRGIGGTPESFHSIAHPLDFRTQVQQQIEQTK
jgi:uncharacterized membrane protein YdbT with pleckstrin-like domain